MFFTPLLMAFTILQTLSSEIAYPLVAWLVAREVWVRMASNFPSNLASQLGGVYMNPDELQSGSNSFHFCWDHRGLNYICLHESGLSCNSFRIEFIPFFIPDWTLDPEWNVDSESYKPGSKFHSRMKIGMKSTFIVAEIKIVCKMGSFIHVFRCISAKIVRKKRLLGTWLKRVSIQNEIFIRGGLSILNSIYHVNTNWVWNVVRDWNSIRILVNYPLYSVHWWCLIFTSQVIIFAYICKRHDIKMI